MLLLSLMLENLSLSYVLNSLLGHKIHRRSIWKKTILKIRENQVSASQCACVYTNLRTQP